ncbi:MAG: hypothetical protein JW955_21010 [Sedimentisphaerales bacterium]|nr:hypothetical protein [Sedimentisphaerales bacterium]
MESRIPNNLIQYITAGEDMQLPSSPPEIQPVLSKNADRPPSRGFSLNITLRLRPFAFAIGVTPLSKPDKSLGRVT